MTHPHITLCIYLHMQNDTIHVNPNVQINTHANPNNIFFENATYIFFLLTKTYALKVFWSQDCLCLFVFVFCFSFCFLTYHFGFHRPDISQTFQLSSLAEKYSGGFYFFFFFAIRSNCCYEILRQIWHVFLRVTPEKNC